MNKKFVRHKTEVSGIFPDYMNKMVKTLCGECNALKLAAKGGAAANIESQLFWDRSKDGRSPVRKSKFCRLHLVYLLFVLLFFGFARFLSAMVDQLGG